MRIPKVVLSLAIAASMLAILMPQADGIIITFGDSSIAFGTPLDDDGNQTVCSDGFELIAASTPNGFGPIGSPTGLVDGSIVPSVVAGVYDASLVDTYGGDPGVITSISTATGFDLIDPDGNVIPTYGQTSVDMIASDTFFELPPSDPDPLKNADAIGSTMFVPTSMLPVGQDVVIVTGSFQGFGSNRRVTVVDCSTMPPLDIEAEVLNNKVKPNNPNKKLRVLFLNDGTFDETTTITSIDVGGAAPIAYKVRDFDGDGDGDLRVTVRTGDTTIACGDTSVTVSGVVNGQAFETVVSIVTKC